MTTCSTGPFGVPKPLPHLPRTAAAPGSGTIRPAAPVVIPPGDRPRYPSGPSGRIPGPENVPIPDPILPLAFAAAVTRKLRLATGILILPQRHPIYVAKEVATLDVLSGGRAILGIGIGWLEEEFDALGVPFAERASRTRQSLPAIRSLWKETPEAFAGKFFRWGPLESNPKPVQKPGVPIVVGGHGEWAARRAARYGDGFFPAVGEPEKLRALFGVLREECRRIGRKPEEIELSAGRGRPDLDGVRRLQDLGASRITMGPPGFDPEAVTRGLHDFAERVIAKL